MLRWLRRIAIAIAIVIVVGVAALLAGFGFWRSGIERELLAKSSVVTTARGPMEYAQIGHGLPVLVIHGTPGGYDLWLNTLEATHAGNEGFRYILPSRPGYLRTPLGDGATPAEQADALAALLDVLHVGAAAVIGVSGGGPAALQFAIRHPDRCTALALEEAVVRSLHQPASAPYALRKAGLLNDLAQEERIGDWPLNQIHCPTLILQGTADQSVPPADARYAHSQIAGSQLTELPGADHLMVIFRARQLTSTIESFLRSHAEANPGTVLGR